jgi:hypothetical protein
MKPYINIMSESAADLKELYVSVSRAGFEIFDEQMKPITADEISDDVKAFTIKTKNPETLIKFTEPEKYEMSTPEDPYYGIALRPMEPYLMKKCVDKEYIDLAAYLELYMQMTEGKYIWFMKSSGF